MKKRILLAGISLMLCMLCGCLETTPLTDEEMDVVAQYASSLLLKYDKNYSTPLYYAEEQEAKLTPTEVPKPTNAPTLTPTPITDEGSARPTGTVKPAATSTPIPTPTPMPYDHEETTKQLTELLAAEDVTVSCTGYELLTSIQSTEYFSLVAKEGRQYAVVKFLLQNNTGEKLIFDASGQGLNYFVSINTKDISRASLSLLTNDLQYMEIPVPAKGTAEAVLAFEIADAGIDTIHLIISDKEDKTVFVKLK